MTFKARVRVITRFVTMASYVVHEALVRIWHLIPLPFCSPVLHLKQVTVSQDEEPWVMYEAGPKSVLCPLICLPPACGTADCFFYIVMKLAEKGYRVISVSLLQYWTSISHSWCYIANFSGIDVFGSHFYHLFLVHALGALKGGLLDSGRPI